MTQRQAAELPKPPMTFEETLGGFKPLKLIRNYLMLGFPKDRAYAVSVEGLRQGLEEEWDKASVRVLACAVAALAVELVDQQLKDKPKEKA